MADASATGFSCMVLLYDSELGLLDSQPFNVTLEEVAKIEPEDIYTVETVVGESEVMVLDESGNDSQGCPKCDGYAEFACMAWNQCWS